MKTPEETQPANASTSKRLVILQESLRKKKERFSDKIDEHLEDVKGAQGEPLRGSRKGEAALRRWDRQNETLRNLDKEIKKTERAIDREEMKNFLVEDFGELPPALREAMDRGEITQWRRFPRFFFVVGVERGRIVYNKKYNTLGHNYVKEIPKDQYPKFRDTYNRIAREFIAWKEAKK